MSTRDAGEQRSLLRVIATILQLTQQEVAGIETRITEMEKTMVSTLLLLLLLMMLMLLMLSLHESPMRSYHGCEYVEVTLVTLHADFMRTVSHVSSSLALLS